MTTIKGIVWNTENEIRTPCDHTHKLNSSIITKIALPLLRGVGLILLVDVEVCSLEI